MSRRSPLIFISPFYIVYSAMFVLLFHNQEYNFIESINRHIIVLYTYICYNNAELNCGGSYMVHFISKLILPQPHISSTCFRKREISIRRENQEGKCAFQKAVPDACTTNNFI